MQYTTTPTTDQPAIRDLVTVSPAGRNGHVQQPGKLEADCREIARALELLVAPGDVVELRSPGKNSRGYEETQSGYFDDAAALVKHAAGVNTVKNTYITVNPVLPELLARRGNRIAVAGKGETTGDHHIARRRWLPLDFDPRRPSGISSTDVEHEAAITLARDVAAALVDEHGFPEPVIADSGNGAHLLFRVDLPNDADTTTLVQRAINRVADDYATTDVDVDRSVFNASRIWKLYGTLSRKGDNVPGRPWRVSKILSAPPELEVVPVEMLRAFAGEPEPVPQPQPKQKQPRGDFSIDGFIREHGIEIASEGPYSNQNGAAYRWSVKTCPFCGESDGAAVILRFAGGKLGYKCHHNRCVDKGWPDFREHYEPGYREKRRPTPQTEPRFAGEMPEVQLPGGDQSISDVGAQLGKLLSVKRTHFYRGGSVVRVGSDDDDQPVLQPTKPQELASDFESVAQLVRLTMTKEGPILNPATCNRATAELIGSSQAFFLTLPRLRVLSRCPVLVESAGELVEVHGYDEGSGVLSVGQPVQNVSLEDAKNILNDALAGFRFATSSDKSRALAAMITPALVSGGLLGGRPPIDLGEADQSQTGKGYRNRITAAIYRHSPHTVSQRTGGVGGLEESFDRALIGGATFIALDNIRGKVDSPAIESFLTEDTYYARCAYSPPTMIDPRRVSVMFTSNQADMTRDLANRSSCVRLLKQPAGFQFTGYPEGDLLAHVKANQPRYLGAVFAVVREWYRRGKPRTSESRHDFRAWAQTLDWIVRNILDAAPLLDGHAESQQRMTNPAMNWLRSVVLAGVRQGRADEWLQAHDLLDIIDAAGDVDIPGLKDGADVEDEGVRKGVLQHIGRKLKRCFGDLNRVCIDGLNVDREEWTDEASRSRYRYQITTISAPPDAPPDNHASGESSGKSPTRNGHSHTPLTGISPDAPPDSPLMRPLIVSRVSLDPPDTSYRRIAEGQFSPFLPPNENTMGASGGQGDQGVRNTTIPPDDWNADDDPFLTDEAHQ